YNVQSLDAFILRLWSGATLARDWHAQALPFSAKIIRNILVGTLFILAALAVWRTRPTQECGDFKPVTGSDYLHYSLMIVLCVTVSTVSWTHYYLLMLLPWTLYISGRLPLIDDRLTHGLVWGSIVLCSIPVSFPQLEPEWLASLYSRSLASVWFFGGLLLFWAFLRSALIRSSETLTPWLPEIFVANAPSALEGAGRKA
ncbi:MAG TPA: hypothetical protein VMI52_12705, partial [Acetobacteraceae bacterium]|nr:hypothetical protein [Acetobacteraceae bacterium]